MARMEYLVPIKVNHETLTRLEEGTRCPIPQEPKPLDTDALTVTYLLKGAISTATRSRAWDPEATIILSDTCRMKVFDSVFSRFSASKHPTFDDEMGRAEKEYELLLSVDSSLRPVPVPLALVELHYDDESKLPAILLEQVEPYDPLWKTLRLCELPNYIDRPFGYESLKLAADIGICLCNTLADLHASGVIVRDLKPENIILCIGGEYERKVDHAMILGLGSGDVITMSGESIESHAPLASIPYGAPEVFDLATSDSGEVVQGKMHRYSCSPSVDLWALGAILYFVVTGEVPEYSSGYQPSGPFEYDEHLRRTYMWPKKDGLRLPSVDDPEPGAWLLSVALQDIVDRCTEYDPHKRLSQISVDGARTTLQYAIR